MDVYLTGRRSRPSDQRENDANEGIRKIIGMEKNEMDLNGNEISEVFFNSCIPR